MSRLSDLARGVRTLGTVLRGRIPRQVVIQYTDACNASCAQCSMRARMPMTRSKLDLEQTRRLLDALAEQGTVAVSFTGGEPFLHAEEIISLIGYARLAGIPFTRTGTNGFPFQGSDRPGFTARINRLAESLARSGLRNFWISLDSADPKTHEANRGLPGVVRGLEKALPIFHEHGIYPAANLGLNRLAGGPVPLSGEDYRGAFSPMMFYHASLNAFRRFYGFVEGLGFTMANACYPMSHEPDQEASHAVYAATSSEEMIRFSTPEKAIMFQALSRVVGEFRSRLRIFTPQSALLTLARQHCGQTQCGPACRGGRDFFFVSARGMSVHPCGYRGEENLGNFLEPGSFKESEDVGCRRCDWECFRDPSILAGPILGLLQQPINTVCGLVRDKTLARAWVGDLRYARACGHFDGRLAPDYIRLAAFSPQERLVQSAVPVQDQA